MYNVKFILLSTMDQYKPDTQQNMKLTTIFSITIILLIFSLQSKSEENVKAPIYFYDTIYTGLTEYVVCPPNSEGLEIAPESKHNGNAKVIWSTLMFPTLIYKSQLNHFGNDTITVLNSTYDFGEWQTDTINYILYCKEFDYSDEKVTVKLITDLCDHEYHETKFETQYEKDSVLIRGTVHANCCAHKEVQASYTNDIINIEYYLTDGGCTCECDYDYEVKIPLQGSETQINFENQLIELEHQSIYSNNSVEITPNPVINSFSITADYNYSKIQIITISGQVVKEFDASDKYDISSLNPGVYKVCVFNGNTILTTATLHISK